MKRYRIFLDAPSFKSLEDNSKKRWIDGQTALDIPAQELTPSDRKDQDIDMFEDSQMYWDEVGFVENSSLALLEDEVADTGVLALASQRLSKLYKGVVFRDEEIDTQYSYSQSIHQSQNLVEESYEWSRSYLSQVESEHSLSALPPPASSPPQATQSEGHSIDDGSSYDTTRISSDTSIQRLPTFRIPMHQLSTLKSLVHGSAGNGKASLLVGLLDVDGPDKVRIRKGPDAGKEISLLKLVLGSPDSTVCKLTVWRELADAWGGSLRRGDVVLLQDILFTRQSDGSCLCTASRNLKSKSTICYRTLPTLPSDRQFRPDLRLAAIDPGVGRVAQVVEWIHGVCGII